MSDIAEEGLDLATIYLTPPYDPLEPWFDKTWRPGEIEATGDEEVE